MDNLKPSKKFLYKLFFVLVILVLLEKGMSFSFSSKEKNVNQLKNADFSLIPEVKETTKENPSISPIPNVFPSYIEETERFQGVYFIKFYGAGKNISSRLVRVSRKVRGNLKSRVKQVLNELKLGPTEEEKKKGIISTLPPTKIVKKVTFLDGILYISFYKKFIDKVGNQILQDRIDQINYTLFENPEIKGIVYFFDGKRQKYIGKENLEVPDIYTKGNRRYIKW